MTDWVSWFTYQLHASADGLIWGFSQIPISVQDDLPPNLRWGTWSPARHIWHVTRYERGLVIPTMKQWMDESPKPNHVLPDDDEVWAKVQNRGFEELTIEFKQIRQQQIDMLPHLAGTNWHTPRDTLWGSKPLSFIVSKTLQHTYEHGDMLLRMVLWWLVETADSQSKQNGT